MPGAEEEVISTIEEKISSMTPISKLIEKGLSPEEILYYILGEENVKILDHMPVGFECTCSKERFGNAIISLGKEEIQEMIDEDGQAEAQCHFCNEKYLFTKDELEELKAAASI